MKKLLLLTLLVSMNAYSHDDDRSPQVKRNMQSLIAAQEAAQRKAPTCNVGATGTGAFCTIISKNVNRAAWSFRSKADSKIQRSVNKSIERFLDKL